MNYKSMIGLLAGLFSVTVMQVYGGGDHPTTPYTGSAEFQQVKSLAGKWEGTTLEKNMGDKVKVEYAATSNGSAVEEKLGVGTPHEMVSIYTDPKGKLTMTHYCSMGNQPRMELKKASKDHLELSFAKTEGIDPNTDGHMHSITLDMPDKDHLIQTWTSWADGKPAGSTVIKLARVK